MVSNSSILIALIKIDKLWLLDDYDVIIPEAVFNEVSILDKPFADKLKIWTSSKVMKIQRSDFVQALRITLGAGESEVISLALEKDISTVFLDDLKARRVAEKFGLKVVGTIGILLKAKLNGKIENLRNCLDSLIKQNIRISKRLYEYALKLADETN